jgi:hypothetical protein
MLKSWYSSRLAFGFAAAADSLNGRISRKYLTRHVTHRIQLALHSLQWPSRTSSATKNHKDADVWRIIKDQVLKY